MTASPQYRHVIKGYS